MVILLTGCGNERENVSLNLWTAAEDRELVAAAVDEFIKLHRDEVNLTVTIECESVEGVKQTVLSNPEVAADVYNFASDQFWDLYNGGALLSVGDHKDEIIRECGGSDALVVKSVQLEDGIYAYPLSASNGYFMFYNSKYFDESQVGNLNEMLEIAASHGKYVAMDWSSGWYLYSFFAGAGKNVELTADRIKNLCDFNAVTGSYKGVAVVEAMLDIAKSAGFKNVVSSSVLDEIEEGNVIAVVSGTWNATAIEELWGENYATCKLPTYDIAGGQVQMRSFAGFKYYGVNAKSKNPEWARQLALYITDKELQMARFNNIGECPANAEAAMSSEVQKSEALRALYEQSAYASVQNVGDNYWEPMAKLGAYIASGNPDNKDLQELLDETVKTITQ